MKLCKFEVVFMKSNNRLVARLLPTYIIITVTVIVRMQLHSWKLARGVK